MHNVYQSVTWALTCCSNPDSVKRNGLSIDELICCYLSWLKAKWVNSVVASHIYSQELIRVKKTKFFCSGTLWHVICIRKHRTGVARSRIQTQLKSWLFQASIHNCLNCVHKCDDHSLLDFKIRSWIYETFHISLHIHSSRDHYNSQMTSSQHQWHHSSVG